VRVAVTGGTGTIGREVVRQLQDRGDEAVAVSRNPSGAGAPAVSWDELDLSGFDGVVNLAGEPLDQRWTDAAKKRIRDSRITATRTVVDALRSADPRPRVLVSQSAEGIYPRGPEPRSEESPPDTGFLADVVQEWENTALEAEELGVRVAIARTGVVLSGQGGALKKMMLPFKAGVGGPVAGGDQPFPWIHVGDAAAALIFLMDTEAARGPVNVVSPERHTNKTCTKALGRAIHRPTAMPVPTVAMKLLYGEMSQMVTEGSNPDPARLEELGFGFRHAQLEEALRLETGKA
jgi:uncharacterized protein (TIGR01777 family)